jgi:hypothetical protein
MMECPMCFQRIIAPQAPASDDVELIIKGSKATRRLVTKPEMHLGMPPAPTPPAKDSSIPGIAFIILLCAVIAAAFVFGGKIFNSIGGQTSEPINRVTSVPKVEKTPPPPTIKPITGLASVIFSKGDSIVVKSRTTADELKDPAKVAFFSIFKGDLARPLAFQGPDALSSLPNGGRVVPGATGNIQWHSSFQGGFVIGVTLQGLVPGREYVLTLNGDPQRVGNKNLMEQMARNHGERFYDFSVITTDMTGGYHATFGIKLPAGQYDVSFFVKDTTDFKIVLQHGFFQFTVE